MEEKTKKEEKIGETLICTVEDDIIEEGNTKKAMNFFRDESMGRISKEEVNTQQTLICTEKRFDDNAVNRETFGQGVLDSGCGKTVCGHDWMETYLDTLDETELEEVKFEESSTRFKFGNGQIYTSSGRVIFPAVLGEKQVLIGSDVVNTEIPLLLSKSTMKKAKTVIDFEHDTVKMFGKKVKLMYTSRGGHYCISLNKKVQASYESDSSMVYFVNLKKIKDFSTSEKSKTAAKLHKQFCHCTGKRLKKLCVDAGVKDKEMLKLVEEVRENCKLCEKYGSTPPKPVVTMALAKSFNESVAMDLKDINSKHVLHLIDHMTRFSAACVIPSKKKEVVVAAVLKIWISIFGCPEKILSDNGGEFNNEDLREMGEKLNTRITTTAAESPWSNGINERHNGLIGEMVIKTMEDSHCSLDIALSWSIYAKNSLANINGYSPHQLVFGKNPNLPSILHDKLPALEEHCNSEVMRKNLNAMHSARKNFVALESSEKLRRALRTKTRTHTGKVFQVGQSVYYKRQNCGQIWKGPGKVIGVDGEIVMIRHGGQGVRVHSSMVKIENSEFMEDQVAAEPESVMSRTQKKGNSLDAGASVPIIETQCKEKELDVLEIDVQRNPGNVSTSADKTVVELQKETEDKEKERVDSGSTVSHDGNAGGQVNDSSRKLPTAKSHVTFKMKGSEEWKEVKILGRGGKATGTIPKWMNVLNKSTNKKEGVNWEEVEEWKVVQTEEVLISEVYNIDEVLESKFAEIDKWKEYAVFEEVDNIGQKSISTRWVCSEKDGKIKSRLVARGYEDEEQKERVDSPTCSKSNLRLVIAIASSKNWRINSLDFQSAFLQGEDVDSEIYLKPPKEANTEKLWKLRKHVYGLKQASRKWYNKVSSELLNSGLSKSKMDAALFFWHCDNELKGLVAGHVDDFFWSGTKELKSGVMDGIMETFRISSDLHDSFNFLGLDIKETCSGVDMDQNIYAEGIQYVPCSDRGDKHRLLTEDEKAPLRSAIGQLCWLANQTRPDIAYDVCQLSVRYKSATVSDIFIANKTIKRVKNNDLKLTFPKLIDNGEYILKVFSDSSFNNLPNGGSQGGYIIFLCDTEDNAAPIQWQSRRIRRVVKSTLAAECLAMEDAVDAAFSLKCVLVDMLREPVGNIRIECFIDNKCLYDNLHSSTNVKEEKRLVLDISLIKEMMARNEINSVTLVDTKEQLADSLTKQGASSDRLCNMLKAGNVAAF